jgi:hypothetical protein
MQYQKLINEQGQVAVLISHGFGAGWSTWADPEEAEALLFDSRIASAVLNNESPDTISTLTSELGYGSYLGGADGLTVEWLDIGTRFYVNEYDGSESIQSFNDLAYIA